MKKSVSKNYIYNLTYQIIAIMLPVITTPYLARVLEPNGIGIYSYTLSIVTYFTLFGAIGVNIFAQREIAKAQDNINKRSIIFWELFTLRTISLSIATIMFLIVFCIQGDYVVFYRILLLELIATIFDISWFFQGMEEFKKILIRNLIIKIISICSIFLFIKTKNDLIIYFIIYVFSNLFGNLTLWINIKKYVKLERIRIKELLKNLKPCLIMFLPQIASSIYTVLDKIMLGKLGNNISETAYYEQSQKIIKIALVFVTSMMTVMIPRISKTYAQGNKKQIEIYMKKTFNFIWLLATPIVAGIMAIATNLVPWFYGDGYEKVKGLLIIASPIIVFIAISTTIGSQYLMSIGKVKIHTRTVIVGAASNVIMNLILIPKMQSIGAVIATIISEFIIANIEIIYVLVKKELKFKTILSSAIKYSLMSGIMGIFTYIIGTNLKSNVITTILQIAVGITIYIILLFITKDEIILKIKNKIKRSK